MIIKVDFSGGHVQFISVSTKFGRKIDRIADRFLQENTTTYILSEMDETSFEGMKKDLSCEDEVWDAKKFVVWVNKNYKNAKAQFLGEKNDKTEKKVVYF